MIKYLFVLLGLCIVKIGNIKFIIDEIPIIPVVSQFASNLYEIEQSVSTNDIEVLNYEIDEDGIWIYPMRNEVILPVSGIITSIKNDSVQIETENEVYIISNLQANLRIYQYYKTGAILGNSDLYYIKTKNISSIVSKLCLYYETI